MSTRLCIKGCGRVATRPARPAIKSYCQLCWQAMPCNQRAQSSRLNPKRRAYAKALQSRRIRVSQRHVWTARTVEEAQQIRAHIRRRLNAFVARQSAGTQTQGD